MKKLFAPLLFALLVSLALSACATPSSLPASSRAESLPPATLSEDVPAVSSRLPEGIATTVSYSSQVSAVSPSGMAYTLKRGSGDSDGTYYEGKSLLTLNCPEGYANANVRGLLELDGDNFAFCLTYPDDGIYVGRYCISEEKLYTVYESFGKANGLVGVERMVAGEGLGFAVCMSGGYIISADGVSGKATEIENCGRCVVSPDFGKAAYYLLPKADESLPDGDIPIVYIVEDLKTGKEICRFENVDNTAPVFLNDGRIVLKRGNNLLIRDFKSDVTVTIENTVTFDELAYKAGDDALYALYIYDYYEDMPPAPIVYRVDLESGKLITHCTPADDENAKLPNLDFDGRRYVCAKKEADGAFRVAVVGVLNDYRLESDMRYVSLAGLLLCGERVIVAQVLGGTVNFYI